MIKNIKEKQAGEKRGINPKIFGLLLFGIILIVAGMNFVSVDTLYWAGASNGNWSDSTNWASLSGGAGAQCNIYTQMLRLETTK